MRFPFWRAGLAASAFAAALAAQTVNLACAPDGPARATLSAFFPSGSHATGGLMFCRAEVQNVDAVAHDCTVEVRSGWSGGDVRSVQRVRLGPQETARLFLSLPTPMDDAQIRFRVDDAEVASGVGLTSAAGAAVLSVLSRPAVEPDALATVRALPTSQSDPTRIVTVAANDLPTDWRLYTGFDGVLVDGRAPVPQDVQEAMRRYVFAGGTLLVAAAERLPAGALRALAGDGRTAVLAHGFGSVYAVPALGDEAVVADLAQKRAPLGNGPLPAPEAFWHAQEVPGLGDVNITVFLAISLVFALAVGPVNFLWLRRRRRPLLILLTVPVLGFGTTLVILGYGFLHDGFGVRGVVTSWTYVDQPRREAATIAARTLFSGLTPGSLAMGAESLLLAPRATEGRGGLDRWHYDHATQRLDGSALPSRVTTPLIGVQQGVARQRLLVRFAGDRAELATDGGVQAVGTAVLCDPDGMLWVGPPSALQRVDRAAADAALADVLRRSGSLVIQNPSSYAAEDRFVPWSVGALAERMAATLRPGEYVVTVANAPWLDEHGLTIAYDRSLHVVRGVLGKEDCQR